MLKNVQSCEDTMMTSTLQSAVYTQKFNWNDEFIQDTSLWPSRNKLKKCCSIDSNDEVETDEEDNNKQIVQQLPAIDDKISEESFKTTIPHNFKK